MGNNKENKLAVKFFIATYFDNLKDALKCAAKKNVAHNKDIFEVIKNSQGYFVVSKSVLKKCFSNPQPLR